MTTNHPSIDPGDSSQGKPARASCGRSSAAGTDGLLASVPLDTVGGSSRQRPSADSFRCPTNCLCGGVGTVVSKEINFGSRSWAECSVTGYVFSDQDWAVERNKKAEPVSPESTEDDRPICICDFPNLEAPIMLEIIHKTGNDLSEYLPDATPEELQVIGWILEPTEGALEGLCTTEFLWGNGTRQRLADRVPGHGKERRHTAMRLAIKRAREEPVEVLPRMGAGFDWDDEETWRFFADDKRSKPAKFPQEWDNVLLWQEAPWIALVWYLPYLYRLELEWLNKGEVSRTPAASLDAQHLDTDGNPVDLHNLIPDSGTNTAAEALRNIELAELSPDNREWFRILFELGVQPFRVVGEKPATARQRKKRLLSTLLPVLDGSGSSYDAPSRVRGSGGVVGLEDARERLKHLEDARGEGKEVSEAVVAHYRRWVEALSLKMASGRKTNPDPSWTDVFNGRGERSWRPCDNPTVPK